MLAIAFYDNLASAELARSVLEDAGIYCFLANRNLVGMRWLYAGLIGLELHVRESDVPAAVELLSGAGLENPAPEPVSAHPACPRCGSESAAARNPINLLTLFALLFGVMVPFFPPAKRCKRCGHKWR